MSSHQVILEPLLFLNDQLPMLSLCLIEDNEEIGELVHDALERKWLNIDRFRSAEQVKLPEYVSGYDIFLIDVMLPWKDGFTLAWEIRDISQAGIIFLTAKWELADKEEAFYQWADDYLTKPFSVKELLLRIEALGQRLPQEVRYTRWDCTIYRQRRKVIKWDKEVHLSPIEREVLWCLLRHEWVVCSRADIIEYTRWGDALFTMSRSLDVTISHLRKKLHKEMIETVTWVGYIMQKRTQ